jgi:hypothetical protein
MQEQNINNNKNGWKIAAIILIVVAVILAGTTTIFAVRSTKDEKEVNQSVSETPNNAEEKEEIENLPDFDVYADSVADARYLTVPEWGLKFAMPAQFSELSYQLISDSQLNFYGVLNDIDGSVSLQFTANDSFASILRFRQAQDPNAECQFGCPRKIGENNGYNYYFNHRQDFISSNTEMTERIATYLLGWMTYKVQFV